MKKLLFLLLFSLSWISAKATTTLTVNAVSIVGTNPVGAILKVTLQNCTNARVVGSGYIVPQVNNYPIPAGGIVVLSLYDNSTQIDCSGSKVSYYSFMVTYQGNNTSIGSFVLVPGTFNLSGLTPCIGNQCIPPISPSGDNTYLRLDGGNGSLLSPTVPMNAVHTAPVGNQQITQPAGTTIFSNSINGTFNEQGFSPSGATTGNVATRINNSVTACGSQPCSIIIPPNEISTGSAYTWTYPTPTTSMIEDQRYTSGVGFANHGVGGPDLHSAKTDITFHGTNLAFENNTNGSGTFTMDLESYAYAGGTTNDQTSANAGALLLYSDRTAGSRPIWGVDINTQYSNLNNSAYAIEIDEVNNSGTDSGVNVGDGIVIIASGNNRSGAAVFIQGSSTQWDTGILVDSYHRIGLEFNTNDATRVADIYIIPPANDTNQAIVLRNAANTANKAVLDDSGNWSASSFSGSVINASTSMSTPTISATTVNAVNAVLNMLPSLSGGIGLQWNLSGTGGEGDFVNEKGGGAGGFNWYNTGTGSIGTPLMQLNGTGTLTVTTGFGAQGSNGFTGSCASTTTLTVKGGIITGCV